MHYQPCILLNMETKLTDRIVIMVSVEQKEQLHDWARESGLSAGEYIRQRIFPETESVRMEQRVSVLEQAVRDLKESVLSLKEKKA
jgi:hypothetical protein